MDLMKWNCAIHMRKWFFHRVAKLKMEHNCIFSTRKHISKVFEFQSAEIEVNNAECQIVFRTTIAPNVNSIWWIENCLACHPMEYQSKRNSHFQRVVHVLCIECRFQQQKNYSCISLKTKQKKTQKHSKILSYSYYVKVKMSMTLNYLLISIRLKLVVDDTIYYSLFKCMKKKLKIRRNKKQLTVSKYNL